MTCGFNWTRWSAPPCDKQQLPILSPKARRLPVAWQLGLRRLLHAIAPPLRSTFAPDQILALSKAARLDDRRHSHALRVSMPFIRGRVWFVVLAGRERRFLDRILREDHTNARVLSFATMVAAQLLSAAISVAIIALVDIGKSALGIDLFDGPSSLDALFY